MLQAAACEERAACARRAQLFRTQLQVTNVRKGTSQMLAWQVQQRVDIHRLFQAIQARPQPRWLRRIRQSTGETVHAAAIRVLKALSEKHEHIRSSYTRKVAQKRGRPTLPYSRAYASQVAALADGGNVDSVPRMPRELRAILLDAYMIDVDMNNAHITIMADYLIPVS